MTIWFRFRIDSWGIKTACTCVCRVSLGCRKRGAELAERVAGQCCAHCHRRILHERRCGEFLPFHILILCYVVDVGAPDLKNAICRARGCS